MQFELLGPLRVRRAEREVDLGFPQQRALLGLLMVRAGRPVQLGEIVDVLWAGRPPASATNVVRRYVGSLRRLLEPGLAPRAPGRRLLGRAGGYLLEAETGEIDLLRFRDLTRQGKRAVATGRPEEAVGHFVTALREWRGPVVAMGIPASVREHALFGAVERELTQTTQMAADAALLCGRTEQVLPGLRRAAELDPLNESLHARLVMVLAATGLQAEALAAYEEVRRRLAAELRVAPGAELTGAHTRVLQQDLRTPAPESGRTLRAPAPGAPPGLNSPTRRPPSGQDRRAPEPPSGLDRRTRPSEPMEPLARPAQLPPGLTVFAGRTGELSSLTEIAEAAASSGAPTTILVSGMAGMGKTALAVRWAHEVADRFPDGQLHAELGGFDPARPTPEPAETLRGLVTALGASPRHLPTGTDALAGLYRGLLAGRRALVLLDDAAGTEQVRPLLPASPGCLALVTSRKGLPGLIASGARPLRLELPSAGDARASLALRVGPERLAAEPGAAEEIIARCGRLPLALAIVAARAVSRQDFPLAAIAAELRDCHGSLDAFAGLGAAFSPSYRSLTPAAARLFRLLSQHPGPDISAGAAADLAGLPVHRARPILNELTDAHLVTEPVPGRYTVHDLLRAFAAELPDLPEPESLSLPRHSF
ncbi:BTAD domain-containing putative transcriptional regulator [Streptomyces sp. NPDC048275]|uniref:AfsR/SARP family transcriptional regulator n=1 Tax=Streptomyces sp. NPDC048275 TaxID=3155629 RepID=UPI0033BFF2D0